MSSLVKIYLKTFLRVTLIVTYLSIRDVFRENNFEPVVGYLLSVLGFYLMSRPIVEFYIRKQVKDS